MTDTLPAFGFGPDSGVMMEEQPKVLHAQFGDGWTGRAPDGLNTHPLTTKPTWTNLTVAESDLLINFFRAKGGSESFYWTPPGEVSPRLFIATRWGRAIIPGSLRSVQVDFQEVFD
jgi:phage-related protein